MNAIIAGAGPTFSSGERPTAAGQAQRGYPISRLMEILLSSHTKMIQEIRQVVKIKGCRAQPGLVSQMWL